MRRTIRFLWKDTNSKEGSCPTIYEADDGCFVLQGKTTADSGVVFVVDNVIDRLPAQNRSAIAHALAVVVGGYMVTGDPITDPAEIEQLCQLGDDEDAVWLNLLDRLRDTQ